MRAVSHSSTDVARVVPVGEPISTDRSVTLLDDSDDAYFSTGEEWNAER